MGQHSERHEFQAEVKQLLDLMIHSLYSHKDVALRELISNASDALDKARHEQLFRPELAADGDFHIRLEAGKSPRQLSIADNGIGMSREEVVKNVGTIAKSGTKEFLAALKKAQGQEAPPDLIGQFGVGFYASFMVAEKVSLLTRRAGEAGATLWESAGDGTYTLSEAERASSGTTVTLHLKPADREQALPDFSDPDIIRKTVKRYSDFVAYPIRMWVEDTSPSAEQTETTGKTSSDEILNAMKAIWDRPKSDVTEAEYKDFYRHISHDWADPLDTLPIKMEGTLEAFALVYIPSKAPFDLYTQEMKRGLQLYVKRVFVMDECKELMPSHLRFIKGVVDAHDLSLNVSREILQQNRQIKVIRKQLVKKIMAGLEKMKKDREKDYLTFWENFGPVLKEGLLSADGDEQKKILEQVLVYSTRNPDVLTSLGDYVDRMNEDQKSIYFLTGNSRENAAKSPLLESFIDRGYEVLLFSDPVDELWLERSPSFHDKQLQSVGRGETELGSEEERKKADEKLAEKNEQLGQLLAHLQVCLQEEVKVVRLSKRLTSSVACLVADKNDMTPRMQKMMEQMGQNVPKPKPILEVNSEHPLIPRLQTIFAAHQQDPRLKLYAELLFGQACLADSGQVPDPTRFSKVLADVMLL